MIKKVKTKKKRNSSMNDEFMKWFLKARFEAMKPKLPHEYTGKLYSIILTYDKWHQEKHGKSMLRNRFCGISSYITPGNAATVQIIFIQVVSSCCL